MISKRLVRYNRRFIMIQGEITKERMEGWKFDSSCEEGFHEIIAPGKADCEQEYIYRLNLSAGKSFDLETGKLEMDAVCIKGAADFSWDGYAGTCDKLDSFYVVSNMKVHITAKEDCIFYIAGAVDEGYGKPFFRKCDLTMPIGEIHQIHGSGVSQREVFMTIDPGTASSRLLVGLTWGGNGAWTSWPPHEHEKDMEEVYCYFDMDDPHFGLHLSYVEPGDTHGVVAHTVKSGTMILAPRGYHPTVAAPGTRNTYLWVLAAHSHKSRRYDLAVLDPKRAEMN